MTYIIVSYKKTPIGSSGESCFSPINYNHACSSCGTGARLKDSLYVRNIKSKKDLFVTDDGDYLISSPLYEKIKNNSAINIPKFKKAINFETKEEIPYYHFLPVETLPEANLEKSSGFLIEGQCSNCSRDGFFNKIQLASKIGKKSKIIPLNLHYEEGICSLNNKSDLLFTWECFGNSNLVETNNRVIRFARPLLLISERLFNLFGKSITNDFHCWPQEL